MFLRPAAAFVQVTVRAGMRDLAAEKVQRLAAELGFDVGVVAVSRIYAIAAAISDNSLLAVAGNALADAVVEQASAGALTGQSTEYLLISRLPGVTDDEGKTAQMVLSTALPQGIFGDEQQVFAQRLVAIGRELSAAQRQALVVALSNPLIERAQFGAGLPQVIEVPVFVASTATMTATVSLDGDDATLVALADERCLHLSVPEMRAIAQHFRDIAPQRSAMDLSLDPTDCELEIFAQTWSEHCKHKEFNALIAMNCEGRSYQVDSLFNSYIRGATSAIRAKYAAIGQDWMLTVFSDNAGVVELDDASLFVLKVETHNSPSALDPVGGAMTGVLGNNRDAFGTGKGGASLLFNTNVLCFGPKNYAKPLLLGQMHPARIASGVVDGIAQAGNKSGVPTVNGAVIFDERYAGKPLVYCGTGAIMQRQYANGASWQKEIRPGYRIVTVGGRVGRDGIHGATFSSGELHGDMSSSVVQIGSPFAQKMVSDFMEQACKLGLVASCTDNGAGGLSSSIGELAQASGGAEVELARVPLKYQGIEPWEILLSESQERMTLAVLPSDLAALLQLASDREVQATDIGAFTASGYLDVRHNGQRLACLNLQFLHHGVPRKHLTAQWFTPKLSEPPPFAFDLTATLLALLASPMICSREPIIRRYDHEVKGKTIVKPLMGETGTAPQDAAVVRAGFDSWVGVAVSSGICPKFGDIDPYAMACGAFDEAVRSLVSVGVRLPLLGESPSWSACDNFCVPDSVYHATNNPDGAEKLGKLVRMSEALYDMSTFFDVPMTSGKDSMKNDFRADGVKISVPPTLLFTMVARMPDVRRAITSEFKAVGDVIFLVGATLDELGASEFYRHFGHLGANVPQVRPADAKRCYLGIMAAQSSDLIVSSHDLSDGGLALALAEACLGGALGADIDVSAVGADLSLAAQLFSESHSRLLVSVRAEHTTAFSALLGADAVRIGTVAANATLRIAAGGQALCAIDVAALTGAFRSEVL